MILTGAFSLSFFRYSKSLFFLQEILMFPRINTWPLSVNLRLIYFAVLFLDFSFIRLVLLLDFCGDLIIFWPLHFVRKEAREIWRIYNDKCRTFPFC